MAVEALGLPSLHSEFLIWISKGLWDSFSPLYPTTVGYIPPLWGFLSHFAWEHPHFFEVPQDYRREKLGGWLCTSQTWPATKGHFIIFFQSGFHCNFPCLEPSYLHWLQQNLLDLPAVAGAYSVGRPGQRYEKSPRPVVSWTVPHSIFRLISFWPLGFPVLHDCTPFLVPCFPRTGLLAMSPGSQNCLKKYYYKRRKRKR